MIGQTISHYRIVEKLGAGGMGEVFLAEDTLLGRKVALKVLPEQFTQDEDRVRRFEKEARSASALNHPNILTIYEIGGHEGVHYIATEFIEGETLRQRMRSRRVTVPECVEIAVQCANALQAAHKTGIVHRDIKPENIMIRPDGYIKLLDFGLAKLTEITTETEYDTGDVEGPTRSLFETQPGMVIGTVAYMSPEQARGQKVDGRTDIFSLGIVLYEMLSGDRPFKGDTISDQIASLLVNNPEKLSNQLPGIPQELDKIVGWMLLKDRELRYQTIQDVLNDLRPLRSRLELTGETGRQPDSQVSYETNLTPAASTEGVGRGTASVRDLSTQTLSTKRTGARRYLIPALVVLVLMAGVGAYSIYSLFFSDTRIDSIAVLPFVNVNNDPEAEYVGEGITEGIINSLSQLQELSVASRNSVIRYRGREADAKVVGDDLSVEAVLLGRIIRRGEDLTINTELVRVSDGRLIWGDRFIRKLTGLIGLQEEITWKITDKLLLRLSDSQKKGLVSKTTDNSEAYQLYLHGRYYWNLGTLADTKKADEFFEAAAAKDPEFALAAAGCAATHAAGIDDAGIKAGMEKARFGAGAALKLDDTIVDAHLTLAKVSLRYDWDFKSAEKGFRRAIELKPKNANSHHRYAEFLALMGRFDEARKEIARAVELDPRSLPVNNTRGVIAYYEKRYDQAIDAFNRTLVLDGAYTPAFTGLGYTYDITGRTGNAVASLIEARNLVYGGADGSLLKTAFESKGRRGFWEVFLNQLEVESKTHRVPSSQFAAVHTRIGDRQKALLALERAFQEKDGGLVELKVDPVYEPLRELPRFNDILRRVGLIN